MAWFKCKYKNELAGLLYSSWLSVYKILISMVNFKSLLNEFMKLKKKSCSSSELPAIFFMYFFALFYTFTPFSKLLLTTHLLWYFFKNMYSAFRKKNTTLIALWIGVGGIPVLFLKDFPNNPNWGKETGTSMKLKIYACFDCWIEFVI